MERYLFFNSGVGDPRTYEASHFADYFGSVLSTGLLHTDNIPGMSVSVETSTLNTIVSLGKAVMKGRLYENTSDLTLPHDIPEVDLDRIDRVILRLNLSNSERNIKLMVLSGSPSATPIEPVLIRDNFIHDISLSQILVRADTVQLLQTDLIDERLDENLAGLAYSLISIPTSQFQAEWDAFMASVQDDGFTPLTTFNEHQADDATLTNSAHVKHGTLLTTLNTTWAGSVAPFTKVQTITDIVSTDTPIIDIVMSGTFATDEAIAEAWGLIYRAVTTTDTITFYATEKPTASLPLQIKVVR